jgi:thioredoxin-related protein
MKFKFFILSIILLAIVAYSFSSKTKTTEILELNTKAPLAATKMMDVSGKELSLSDIKNKNGLLVVFSCNTCPFVVGNGEKSEGWENRYTELGEICKKNEFGMVLVNSNEAKRNGDDSMEEMINHSKKSNYNCNYVVDKNHLLADAFGARTTPHVFLFDTNLALIYKGAIDDNVDSKENVKTPYLKNAIQNQMAGKKIDPNSTKQMGCSIKRVIVEK